MAFNLLEQYGVNEEDIPENVSAGRRKIADGVYPYTITDFSKYDNESKNSESLYIDYDFGDDGTHREWFTTKADDEDWVTRGFSDLRKRLAFFGQSLSDFRPDEVIGRTGTLEIVTAKSGKSQYINEFSVDEEGEEEPEGDAPMALAEKAPAKAAPAKATAKAGTASRGTAGNPFGAKK